MKSTQLLPRIFAAGPSLSSHDAPRLQRVLARVTGALPVLIPVLIAFQQGSASAQQQVAPSSLAAYTAQQARTGAEVYERACATCHLPSLLGSFEAPPLAGPNFRIRWVDQPVAELLRVTCVFH